MLNGWKDLPQMDTPMLAMQSLMMELTLVCVGRIGFH